MAGKLYVWGDNANGTAGDGYAALKLSPTQTISEGDWDDIQNGDSFAVALKDGKLYSWGRGTNSRTGQGNTLNLNAPTQIGSDSTWESYSVGDRHTLAIKTDGTLWSWGSNANGRTGQGTTSSNTTAPTQVGVATDWASISAGTTHSLAIKDDGTLWSWGGAANGRLGNGTTTPDVTSPAQIGVATDWDQISAGNDYSLAIKDDGTLWAWGANASGQLGTGNTTEQTSPLQVGVATDWASISAGGSPTTFSFSLATKTGGTAWSWGNNASGTTGLGTISGTQTSPAQIGVKTDWEKIEAGVGNSVGIAGGKLYAWGGGIVNSASLGGVGDGTINASTSPVEIDSNTGWTAVSSYGQSFALRGGNIYFWGVNTDGVSGEGRLVYLTSPTQVGSATDWESVADGAGFHTLAIRDSKLFATGSQRSGMLGNNTDSPLRLVTLTQTGTDTGWAYTATSGYSSNDTSSHSMGIRNGELYGWGVNSSYQLGASGTSAKLTPVKIGSDSDWDIISCGDKFSVGLRDGKLFSCGENANGKTGLATNSGFTQTFTQIGSDTDWAYVNAGTAFVLAIKDNGTLWAWGRNTNGQLGDASTTERTSPVQIGVATDWALVSAGDAHSLAVTTDGKLFSWGNRSNGRLGDGNTSSNTTSPTQVGSDTNWDKVAAGYQYSLALKTTGTLWGWGINSAGQIGDSSITQRTSPVQIGSGNKWLDVGATIATSFAIESVNVAPANTAAPTVSGTAKVGETLTTTDGTWTGTPAPTYAYKWQVSDDGSTGWSDISGATSSTFTITSSEAGKYLRSQVTATNSEGSASSESTASSQIVEDPTIGTPTISGTAKVGETLTASASATAGFPSPTITYEWQSSADNSSWSAISGATSSSYVVDSSLAGLYIRVEATATNTEGTDSDTSTATAQVVQDPVVDIPTISGTTKVGQVLTATANATEGFPSPSISYQWKRANSAGGSYANILGATSSTYTLVSADLDKYIKVEATATNSEGSDSQLSAASGPITQDAPPPPPEGDSDPTGAIIGAISVIRRF